MPNQVEHVNIASSHFSINFRNYTLRSKSLFKLKSRLRVNFSNTLGHADSKVVVWLQCIKRLTAAIKYLVTTVAED